METLPHELIAAFGDYLAPKYRCRLFMCCKLWYRECFWPQRWLFRWYAQIANINKSILTIKYNVVGENDGCEPMSEIIKPNGRTVYAGYTKCETTSRYNLDNETYIVNTYELYEYFDGINLLMYIDGIDHRHDIENFNCYRKFYLEGYIKENDYHTYNLYLATFIIIKYLTRAELTKFAIAFGAYIYELISDMCRDEKIYKSYKGGTKIRR